MPLQLDGARCLLPMDGAVAFCLVRRMLARKPPTDVRKALELRRRCWHSQRLTEVPRQGAEGYAAALRRQWKKGAGHRPHRPLNAWRGTRGSYGDGRLLEQHLVDDLDHQALAVVRHVDLHKMIDIRVACIRRVH